MSQLRKGVFSSIFLVGESILNKLIGLLSTLILARVLLPEDFGIVAIATLTIGFFSVLSNTGSVQYLLRAESINDSEVNTSWTINLIIRFLLTSIISGVSFLAAEYYGDERLPGLIVVLSIVFFFSSLNNPATIFLKRKQEYTSIIKINIFGKVLAVITAVTIALVYESYWALVLGQVVSATTTLICSYIIFPYAPKLELSNAKRQWAFSGWMIPQSIFGYLRTQLDTILVSSVFGKGELGSYHTMKYIAFIPTSHLILPITETLLVELRKSKVARSYFCDQYNASLLLTMLLAIPIAIFLLHFHEISTRVLLGNNWVRYSELLAAFGLLIPASAIHRHCCRTIIVFNKPKYILYYEIFTFTLLYSVLFFVGLDDLLMFTYLRVGMEQVICLFFLLYVSLKYTTLITTLKAFLGLTLIIVSGVITIFIQTKLPISSSILFVDFILKALFFFISFYSVFIILYLLCLRRFSEWKYIHSLFLRITEPFIVKYK